METLRRETSMDGLTIGSAGGVWNPEARDMVRASVGRVVVHDHGIEIVLQPKGSETTPASGHGDDEGEGQKLLKAPLPAPRARKRKDVSRRCCAYALCQRTKPLAR